MKKIKNKKVLFKKVSIIICFLLLIVLIDINSANVNAVDSTLPTTPTFNITMNPIIPNPAMVREDINVSGVITPNSFESDIPKKEIVLVLDTSGSMDDEVNTVCTNSRVRHEISYNDVRGYDGNLYTYVNNNKVKVTKINNHYYIDDYCEEHKKVGEHTYTSTKIEQLKKAALNFIDKMNDVPNLKIGIVAYSSKAWINPNGKNGNELTSSIDASNHPVPNYISASSNLLDITDSRLPNMINNLEALGGTNTGEGMRKAAYMLRNENGASKTIVLMSDGLPTFYSIKGSNNRNYYTTIDNTNPYYAGNGTNDNSNGNCLNYAKAIGGLIKEKGYNVFSIGYGLDTSGNNKLSQIHQSMGGSTSTTDETYFATDAGAIDGIFDKIADTIINSYTITNVKVNLNLDSNFSLNVGGNSININNIVYTLTSQSNGKYIYTASPINFSFTIKGNTANVYDNIFQGSQLSVPWNGDIKTTDIPKISATIKNSGLPDIQASKKSLESEPYEVGKIINAIYTITPKSFVFQSSNGSSVPKDVVILLDISSAISGKLDYVKQAISNKLLHDNELQTCKSRYSIVTYSNDAVYNKLNENDTDVKQKCNSESNYSDLVKQKILDNISVSSSNNRNISNALALAQNILDNGRNEVATSTIDVNRGTGSKNIIIIGGGSITDQDSTSLTTEINNIKSKNYNIITFNVGQVISGNEEPNNNLKSLHYRLIGKEETSSENISEKENNNYYINVDYRKFNANNPHSLFLDSNNINSNNTIEDPVMLRIANKLKGGIKQSYTFKAKLKFNKGKFDIVSGLTSHSDGNYNVETNEFNIIYTLKNGSYSADPFDISFQIKPNESGTLEFGKPGFISYTNLENELTGNPIDSFSVTVRSPIEIKSHGIYEGIKSGEPSIDDRENFNLSKGTNVTLGATLLGTLSSSSGVSLEIPDGVTITDTIKVYTYDTGSLIKIGTMILSSTSNDGKKIYTYQQDQEINTTGEKILILYSEKLPESPTKNPPVYTNRLCIPSDKDDVNITIDSQQRDLF